jgi:dihydroflavonol-4-reductase
LINFAGNDPLMWKIEVTKVENLKILVTGATGLLGSTIARQLHQEGHAVSALYRPDSDRRLLDDLSGKISWVEGDILDRLGLEEALSDIDMVVHAAATVSFVPKERATMFKINIEGTANVVNACFAAQIKKLCHISSVAALGRPDKKTHSPSELIEIDEENRWVDSASNSQYAVTKYLAELEVWRGIAEGLNAVIINPSVILGEGDWHKSSTRLFKYVFDEKPFYSEGVLNFVDVKDVSEAACRLLFSDISAERFVVNGGTVPYHQFFTEAATAFNKKPPKWKVNSFVAEVVWRFEALRSFLTGKAPLLTKETARAAQHRYRFNGDKLTKMTGIAYRDLGETLSRVSKTLRKAV